MNTRILSVLMGAASIVALTPERFALAQSDQPAASRGGEIEEVVVTARRREEKAQTVPITLTTFSPVQLEKQDIRDSLTAVTLPNGTKAPIGNLMDELDFTQTPLSPVILSTHIPTGIQIACRGVATDHLETCTKTSVVVSWNAVTGADVPGPFTYHVQRDGVELAQCTGIATQCTDIPGPGTHLYRAYSVSGSGVASPISAAAEADVP